MRWAEIRIETTPQAQDAIGELMIENGCAGLAIEGESPLVIRCYLPVDDRLEERLLNIQIGLKELPKFDWQFLFVVGIFFGSLISAATSRSFQLRSVPPMWESRFGPSPVKRGVVAFLGGVIAMFGARLADG